MKLTPTDREIFFSRQDPEDPRLGDWVRGLTSISTASDLAGAVTADSFVVCGYPDDEGIRVNGGRPGAAQAPKAIRRPLYKMTPSLVSSAGTSSFFDAGDLLPSGLDLAERHAAASAHALAVLSKDARWIALGGGHDYGFSDADAYCEWASANGHRPLVINFDAHLDVRPTSKGLSSGTPFFRMIEKHHARGLDFVEIGIQSQCNSRAHVEWLKSRGGRILFLDEWLASGENLETYMTRHLDDLLLRPRPAFISVDIDAFSSAVAPGCSQSWATGFMPREFFATFDLLLARLDVRALGVYEVSPPLDHDDRTSKLAAQIVHRFLFSGAPK
ncbi:MAG: formimidoylglutamase [Bdellovibrionota bacterium]